MFLKWGRAQSLRQRGSALLRAGKYAEALPLYAEAVALSPRSAPGWDGFGQALLDADRIDEAVAALDTATRLDPRQALVWNSKGTALSRASRHEEALAAFDRACALDPDALRQRRTLAHRNRLQTLTQLERYAEALAATDTLVQYAPRDAEVWARRGLACAQLNRFEDAEEALLYAVKLAPTNWLALTYLRFYYASKARDNEKALATCERLVAAYPNYGDAWKLKGDTLVASRRYDDANSAYERAVKCGTQTGEHLVRLWGAIGWALIVQGRYPDALAAMDTAASYASGPDAYLLIDRGSIFSHIGRYAEALELNEAASNVPPAPLMARCNVAEALVTLGHLDQAKAVLDAVFAVDGQYGCAWYARGRLDTALGHYEDARAAFDVSIKLESTHASHYQGLAGLLLTLDEGERALQVIERALAIDAYSAQSWRMKAQALHVTGREEEADDAEQRGAVLLAEQVAQVDGYLRAKEHSEGNL